MRMKTAATAVPSATPGSVMMARLRSGSRARLTKSTGGAHCSHSEKARISMVACQNTGIERLNRLTRRTT